MVDKKKVILFIILTMGIGLLRGLVQDITGFILLIHSLATSAQILLYTIITFIIIDLLRLIKGMKYKILIILTIIITGLLLVITALLPDPNNLGFEYSIRHISNGLVGLTFAILFFKDVIIYNNHFLDND